MPPKIGDFFRNLLCPINFLWVFLGKAMPPLPPIREPDCTEVIDNFIELRGFVED